ncbi:hypothetical protein IP90_02999 [Luteimonas cucumeris]|uniref:YCII-related domain-containing protein n=1 Tax=Luteimonas cucumeris TaxID=985012 RepID=A0A562KX78_9GAMM|nr:YciI family protein [Luteimonas cucumeris]TWH99992.1 hypothetical protein IP90_02999 [Luteimonas cucumeris]
MKYLVLIYDDPPSPDALSEGEVKAMARQCRARTDELQQGGQLLDSRRLEPSHTATCLRVRNGRVAPSDDPSADDAEQLGGVDLIEARDLNDAIRVATRLPWARGGRIELRPLRALPD